jgi:hypothetical protein
VLQHNCRPGLRPYIHPLRGPDGRACLTEDSPWHHPWQHGISTGFHGVNECDFWLDPGQMPDMLIGTIDSRIPRLVASDPPEWTIEAMWRHDDGSSLLLEQQTWSLEQLNELLYLDLVWRMQAIPDICIQKKSYGGLFLRMPFAADRGAAVFNSSGLKNDDCEQQRAAWVDLHMPIDSSEAGGGITICDHPGNPGYPAYWRVDSQRGINPSPCIPGEITLPSGQSTSYKYRFILHLDPLSPEEIERHFNAYAAE